MGSKTALCSSTWALCTSTCALQTVLWSHETSKRPPGPILERFRTPLGGSRRPKNIKYNVFYCVSRSATDIVQIVQSRPLEGLTRPSRGPQERPGTPQERPKRRHDSSKSAKKRPKCDSGPSDLGGQVGLTCIKTSPFWIFAGCFAVSRGRISYSFFCRKG